MVTGREQLVDDWRKRLAAAEDSHPDDSPRAKWSARVRVRLYRFLLALYGEGQWRESNIRPGDNFTLGAELESLEAVDLAGKPAKDAGQISATLRAVAAARPTANKPGPLADGIGSERWVTIAALSGGINPQRLAYLLQSRGIMPRVTPRISDLTLEVRNGQQAEALRIMLANINAVRCFATPLAPSWLGPLEKLELAATRAIAAIPPRWRFHLVSAGQLLLVFPLAWLFASLMLPFSLGDPDPLVRDDRFNELYWMGWCGILFITLLLIWLRAHWASRHDKLMRQASPPLTGAG